MPWLDLDIDLSAEEFCNWLYLGFRHLKHQTKQQKVLPVLISHRVMNRSKFDLKIKPGETSVLLRPSGAAKDTGIGTGDAEFSTVKSFLSLGKGKKGFTETQFSIRGSDTCGQGGPVFQLSLAMEVHGNTHYFYIIVVL